MFVLKFSIEKIHRHKIVKRIIQIQRYISNINRKDFFLLKDLALSFLHVKIFYIFWHEKIDAIKLAN